MIVSFKKELSICSVCIHFVVCTGALVGLENDFFEVEESVSSFNVCVELKSPIKLNITIHFTAFERTALGKSIDYSTRIVISV